MQPLSSTQNLQISATETVTPTQFYTWKNYRCAYEVHTAINPNTNEGTPLLLIHPIGVGLSRKFWQRFCREWYEAGRRNPIYNPDLLGCGESDMPHVAYSPLDWAQQLQHFLQTVVKKPVIVVVQGALLPVAIELVRLETNSNFIRGLVLAGPPALTLLAKPRANWRQKLTWNLLDSPFGSAFYRYARREQFLRSFSTKQLFEKADSVDREWLQTLEKGATDPKTRHAVFSFLAGFWRQDYRDAIASISQPTLVVVGDTASSISQAGKGETPDERLADYQKSLPNAEGIKMLGRNVLPYESTVEFVNVVTNFVAKHS
ncbi:alpha/beta hydrolase [Coleofasciculus sp. FACHB-712]|uniref:alpha/beta fold hydrolase n=1 Tax=Cyanophyceae TaxID=3028117 RepID=UPI0016836B14|nr:MULTISPECIES: alpha/beta hydrolase [unclassified Coleofasciculus]MBD1943937.1 alpha/beta hydrolase [Coleofasciculus sp. FACHB-712]MBD2540326.1 alpha/beta hydrolase [Coleofasciculus sp. FACHB-SPT36]